MRKTLLTAQKMADSIVHEAEAKRDALLAQAETEARDRIAQLRREAEEAEERLRQGQQELARFIAASREVCNQELSFLDQLPQLPPSLWLISPPEGKGHREPFLSLPKCPAQTRHTSCP